MRRAHTELLACPSCHGALALAASSESGEHVVSGTLGCSGCGATFPIEQEIPRFVSDEYAGNFGFQWNKYARTQYDSESGLKITEKRFFEETAWPRDLSGERVLEVGCGAGRFTEQIARTGATVVSLDLSSAVLANHAAHRERPNVLVVQGSIGALPIKPGSMHRACALGMLQHTPDVERSFRSLLPVLAPGGWLAVDVYRRQPWWKYLWMTRYWVRPLTKRLPAPLLHRLLAIYVAALWPLARLINKLPRGRSLNRLLLLSDYRGVYELSEQQLREWCLLDTFDYLSAYYDQPQTIETVRRWFAEAALADTQVVFGHNGIEGRGRKPV